MSLEYSAFESGFDRFIRLDKEVDFIGKKALIEWQDKGFKKAFVVLQVQAVVDTDLHEIGTELEIEILGDLFKATVIEESPYDPQNGKLRA